MVYRFFKRADGKPASVRVFVIAMVAIACALCSLGIVRVARQHEVLRLGYQLSRESERRENKRPQLSDLRDSGSIEQDADVVLFLYREGMHNRDVDRAKTDLLVAKNRNGPTDDLKLVFIEEQTAFKEPYLATE